MLELVDIGTLPLETFDAVLSPLATHALHRAEVLSHLELTGRRIWNITSAEHDQMLDPLLAYAHGSGVATRWAVIDADPAFFMLTRRLKQNLQGMPGDGGPLDAGERALYERELAATASELSARIR